ncbi:MAG TPA: D-alanyl-D-alanine carboxypeptidase, partial [Streptomyces sp.]
GSESSRGQAPEGKAPHAGAADGEPSDGSNTERGEADAPRDDAEQASIRGDDKGAEAGSEGPGGGEGGSGDLGGARGAQGASGGVEGGSERAAEPRDADAGDAEADSEGSGERRPATTAAKTDADDAGEANSSQGAGDPSGDDDNSARNTDTSDDAESDSPASSTDSDEDVTDADEDAGADSAAGKPTFKAEESDSPAPEPKPDTDDADPHPLDQPTAIFKAVRPKPHVDQPTTMLKLGDVAKPTTSGEKPGATTPAAGTGAAGEAGAAWTSPATKKPDTPGKPDAEEKPDETDGTDSTTGARKTGPTPKGDPERTSTFVALKPLDDPATKKPRTPRTTSEGAATTTATTAVPQVGPERTTQQPLPPKPPLDLLAELTNTPPPPPTPLRTLARRVKIWTPLVLLLVVVFAIAQMVRPLPAPTLQLTAEKTYTFDGGKAEIPWPAKGQAALEVQGIGTFGSSGEQKPVPIASVAKVMTAYLILRDHPLKADAKGPMIKVDQAAQDQASADGESTVKVTAGDEISEREALQGILIASANNIARLVARWDAGSETAFVAKMNAAAKDLGMTNTTYTDPSGLHDTTVSTAVDQVKLAEQAMKDPAFRSVASMMEYYDYKGARQPNWNQLVGKNNVIGIKTGTTTSARGNLVFAATKEIGGETRTVFGAVLRQPEGGFDNTILQGALSAGDTLIRAAQKSLESATILKKGDVVGYVDDGVGGRTPVVATKDVTAVGWAGLKVKLSFVAGDLPHTAKAGTQVGTLTVGDGGSGSAVQVPVALKSELAEPGFGAKLTRIG